MAVAVVDASALVACFVDDGPTGRGLRARLRMDRLAAPEVLYLEVANALKKARARGALDERRSAEALRDLLGLSLRSFPHSPFLARIWELRENLSPYDAAYVALAEALRKPLLTADRRLARAPGVRCEVELLS